MPLNVAILAWEYPPRIIGDMSRYVEKLSQELSEENNVFVISFHDAPYLHERISDTLEVHRMPNPVQPHVNVVTWALTLGVEIQRIFTEIYYAASKKVDIIDAHEWQFVIAATGLKRALGLPFILTFHSLENQRSSDPSAPLSTCIRGLERIGAHESDKIITRSTLVKSDVERVHQIPSSKVRYIPVSGPGTKETLEVYNQALAHQ